MRYFAILLFLLVSNQIAAQWVEKADGIYGANIQSMVSDGPSLFAGTTNGVYRSIDGGTTWAPANAGMINGHVYSLAVLGGNLFAGVDDAIGPIGGGVYVSANGGATWTTANTGLTNLRVNDLAVVGSNLFAATFGGGVFISTNAGASWSPVNTGITDLNTRTLFVSGTNLFVGTGFGSGSLFLTTDNGSNWTNLSPSTSTVTAMAQVGTNLFAGGNGVFLSTDNGSSWTPVNTGLTNLNVLALTANGTNLFAGTTGGNFLSTNNGTSWASINAGMTTNSVQALYNNGGTLFSGTFGSLYVSTNNGSSWAPVNTGLTNTIPNDLLVVGTKLYSGSNGGIHLSTNSGTTWTTLNAGLTNTIVHALEMSAGNLLAGTEGGGVFLSTDNGLNWSASNSGMTNFRIRDFQAIGTNLFVGTFGGGVFLSVNNGVSWAPVNAGLSSTFVYKLAAIGGNLFAGTFGGCFLSTNNGASWTAVNSGLTNTIVQALTVNGTNLFAGTRGGIFLSTNNGSTWTEVSNGLSTIARAWTFELSAVPGHIVAATLDGIYLTADNGANWSSINAGLSDLEAESITALGGDLYAGIIGRNVWIRPVTELGFSLAPTITSFTPASGPVGTTVSITGTNFDATPANNIVHFGATRATVTAATTTQLTVTVPTGATYQPITVQVAGLTAFSSKPFLVTFTGGGSFDACSLAPKVDFTAGTSPFGVLMADFDGDGKPDVAAANRGSKTLLVYRNSSTIGSINTTSLDPPISRATPFGDPLSLVAADMDGDGKLDIVLSNAGVSNVSVYRNTSSVGSLSFDNRVDYATGSDPITAAINDLDSDGKPEIVVCNRFGNSISILKNTSTTGGFTAGSFAPKVDFPVGNQPYGLAIADLDGDGKPDVVAANSGSGTVSVLRNISTVGVINSGSLAPTVDFTADPSAHTVILSDIDGDSKPDIIVASTSVLAALRNISTSGITTGSFESKVSIGPGTSPVASDIDGDGKVDIITNSTTTDRKSVFRNTATLGTIAASSFAPPVDFVSGWGLTFLGDLDGDGKPDLLTANNSLNTIPILRNVLGEILSPTIVSFTPSSGPIGTTVNITGSNFTTPFANSLMFNGVSATISSVSATTITTSVPAGATTGPIEVTIGCNTVTAGVFCMLSDPTATGNSGCSGTSITLGASGASPGQYRWYTMATGGTPHPTQQNDTFSTPAITTTTDFWVAINDGTCESGRQMVTATAIPLPVSPGIVLPPPVCPGSGTTLTASGTTNGNYRWYDGSVLISGEVNSTFTTPALSVNRTYGVAIYDGTCESPIAPVVAAVQVCSAPVITTSVSAPFLPTVIRIDLAPLLSDPENNLDLDSIQIISGLPSGATATLEGTELVINYNGIPFPGIETIVLEVCDLTGLCTQETLTINLSSEISIFNAMSPNSDAKNETFFIENIDLLPDTQENKVTIFNRWGSVVFETTNYNNTTNVFKGIGNDGSELPPGTYYYSIEFSSGAPKRTGFIALRK